MQQIQAPVTIEADEDIDRFAIFQENGVLPPSLPREDNPTPTASRLHLERGAVNVNGVGSIVARSEAPELDLPEGDPKIDTVQIIYLAVDFAHALELEGACRDRICQLCDRSVFPPLSRSEIVPVATSCSPGPGPQARRMLRLLGFLPTRPGEVRVARSRAAPRPPSRPPGHPFRPQTEGGSLPRFRSKAEMLAYIRARIGK